MPDVRLGCGRIAVVDAITRAGLPSTKRKASTWPSSLFSARSVRKAFRRRSSMASSAELSALVNDQVTEFLKIKRAGQCSFNDHIAAVAVVAHAVDDAHL